MEGFTFFFTYEETICHGRQSYDGMQCAMGADLSQGGDFCSFVFLFPLRNGCFGIKTLNYISEFTLQKLPAAMRQKYQEFMDEGSLTVMDGTILDMMEIYEDLENHIAQTGYDVRSFGYDPYNAKEFVGRWILENGEFAVEKVAQGARTETVPLTELKKLASERMLIFDQEMIKFTMGNAITIEDTNGNKKLLKKSYEAKIDSVAAMMDALVAYKLNKDAFE
jgi:phage terminase large subunit-like protein